MADENKSSPLELVRSVTALLLRRKWAALLTFATVTLATIFIVRLLPARYTSEATMVMAEQKVSVDYAATSDKATPGDTIMLMKREILSHARLLEVINELGLYPLDRARPPELLTAAMREEIVIEPLDEIRRYDFRAFRVAFTSGTPELARATVEKLTSLFIEENEKNTIDRATRSVDFVGEELEAAKQKVDQQERLLRSAKVRSAREEYQQKAAIGNAAELRTQLLSAQASLRAVQNQRFSLESLIAGTLATLQTEKETLATKFTASHPNILKKDEQIARVQGLLTRLRTGSSASAGAAAGADDPTLAQFGTQVNSVLAEIDSLTKEERQLRSEVAVAQAQEGGAPVTAAEVSEIEKNSEIYRKQYADLVAKQQQAQRTANLSTRKEAERFRVIEPPSLPVIPSSPKRMTFDLGGAGAGLLLGLILAVILDMGAGALHSEAELRAVAPVPLVLSIPVMLTPSEERRMVWKHAFEWVGAFALVLMVAGAEYWVYKWG